MSWVCRELGAEEVAFQVGSDALPASLLHTILSDRLQPLNELSDASVLPYISVAGQIPNKSF